MGLWLGLSMPGFLGCSNRAAQRSATEAEPTKTDSVRGQAGASPPAPTLANGVTKSPAEARRGYAIADDGDGAAMPPDPYEADKREENKKDSISNYSASPSPTSGDSSGEGGKGKEGQMGKTGKDGNADPEPVTSWKQATSHANDARLMIGDKEGLTLTASQFKVEVDGVRARVLADYYFTNDDARSYEGTFQLRLPDGASPYFFAFGETRLAAKQPVLLVAADAARSASTQPVQIMAERAPTWENPREARMVPREKAAYAYTETVRKRVDPALMEWAGAGVFSARVFPLTGNKVHRIVFGYDVDVARVGADIEYRLDLPEHKDVATVVDLAIADGLPTATLTPATTATRAKKYTYYRFERPKAGVTVRWKQPGAVAITGSDATGAYFAVSARPTLPAAPSAAVGKRAVFMIDTSLSSNPERFAIWLELVTAVLDENRGDLGEFAVELFDLSPRWWRPGFSANTPENVAALRTSLNQLSLEGATDLGAALHEANAPAWAKGQTANWDLFLLSDGAATWGESDGWALASGLRGHGALFAYSTGMAGTDRPMLDQLARESGGAVFSVAGAAEVKAAARAHRARPWQLEGVAIKGGDDLLVAGRPTALFAGQELRVVGRGALDKEATLIVKLRQGDVTRELELTAGVVSSSLAARAYGQIAVGELESLAPETEKTALAYANHFRVTGQSSSLLMLETEQDYQRFGLEPQADAAVVVARPAAREARVALAEIGASLGDPKVAFLAWVERMRTTPGINLELPADVLTALKALPREAFTITVPALPIAGDRSPAAVAELLRTHTMDYDALTAEAAARRKRGHAGDALRVLSSLVEENPGDAVLARDVAFSAMEWGLGGQAVHLLRRVAAARPYEPETYRALAGALAELGRSDLAMAYYEVGLAGSWDGRFGEFKRILAMDYQQFLRKAGRAEAALGLAPLVKARLGAVRQVVGVQRADVVVMITWNTDATDVDLHVLEPTGEEVYYGNRNSRLGGELTQDVTQGFGPEMYVLKAAPAGDYSVRAKYFASDRNRASARSKVYATVIRNFGSANERSERKVVTLETGKEMHSLTRFKIAGGAVGAAQAVEAIAK